MVDLLAYQLAALFGAILAIVFGTVATYYKKWLETKELGIEIKFEKRFIISAAASFAFAIFAGLLAFDEIESNINYDTTILKVFASAFISGVGANFGINAFMKPSSVLVAQVRELKEQNSELRRLNKSNSS